MDDHITRLAIHSQEPKIILHGGDDVGPAGESDSFVVELQVSSSRAGSVVDDGDLHNDSVVEDDDIDQLVIQDSAEDVVQYDDEDAEDDEVAMDTCVVQMGEDEEDEAVAVARVVRGNGEGESEGREMAEDEEGCGDYLMISLDEAGKMVSGEEEGSAVVAADDKSDGQEVIKVYIFKADDTGEDMGDTEVVGDEEPSSGEKMVYMSVGDSNHSDSKLSEEVYMEVVVGGEEANVTANHARCYDNTALSKEFTPATWASAYDSLAEPRNGAASAFLHMEDPIGGANKGSRRRTEPRQVQTAIIIGPYGQPLTVYPCFLCGKKFKSRGFLRRHQRTQHQELLTKSRKKVPPSTPPDSSPLAPTFSCETCGQSFSQQPALFTHRLQHHPPEAPPSPPGGPPTTASSDSASNAAAAKTLQCRYCAFRASDAALLQRHLQGAHNRSFPHTCAECGKGFRHPSEMRKHARTHTGERPFRCPQCSYKAADASNLKTHMKSKHGSQEPPFRCEQCSQSFAEEDELSRHVSLSHPSAEPSRGPVSSTTATPAATVPHQCPHCDHRSSNSSDLKRHVISCHTKEYPHVCEACGKGFHRPSELKKHEATHKASPGAPGSAPATAAGTAKKLHQCRHCSFKIADPFVLSRHILSVHTKESAGSGQDIDADGQSSPTSAEQLSPPLLSPATEASPAKASGNKKSPSSVKKSGGGSGGGGGGGGGNKARVVAAQPPRERRVYQCQYCDYSTGDASGFKRHVISIHTKDYPHRCEYCSKGFRRPSEKNQHIARHHKDVIQPSS